MKGLQRKRGVKMKNIQKVVKGTGKVVLALMTAVLMPVLIWVAMGVAVNHMAKEKSVQRKLAPVGKKLAVNHTAINEEK
ncbi:MAG: hypothetical protein A2Z70_00870 [Chloroflexi bacterium RBG_13_48_17]|nr:MAG: hypothetical protein A2Z70_00870 [Chloroflexi bacterium RBG_13_48_17]